MTKFANFRISVADRSTRDICSIYLVGGFDEDKNHYFGRPEFRGKEKQACMDICVRAERGQIRVQRLLKGNRFEKGDKEAMARHPAFDRRHVKERACKFRGLEYSFEVDSIDPETLDFLTWEVIAQVNEW